MRDVYAHAFHCESWHVAYTQCSAFRQQYVTHSGGAHTHIHTDWQPGRQAGRQAHPNPVTLLMACYSFEISQSQGSRQQASAARRQSTGSWQLATATAASELPITARQCIKMP